jgi:hypothetical protein
MAWEHYQKYRKFLGEGIIQIIIMSLVIESGPAPVNFDYDFDYEFSFESRWHAVGNPIIYTLQRKDYNVSSVSDSGGFAKITITGGDYTSDFVTDDSVYFSGYGVTTTVTSATFTGGNTEVVLGVAYSNNTSGFVNLMSRRTGYYIVINVYSITEGADLPYSLRYTPDSTGLVTVDVSRILRTVLIPELDFETLSLNNAKEADNSVEFYIKYQEFYSGSSTSQTSDSDNKCVAVLASRQIGDENGGNMIDYTPIPGEQKTFLTKFTNPTIWINYPFSISFIYPEEITGASYTYEYRKEDETVISSGTSLLQSSEVDFVNRLTIGIVSNENAYAATLGISYDSETLISNVFKVREVCDNPVYLFWKNSLGGDSYWMFSYGQDVEYAYSSNRKAKRMRLFAENLTIDEWEAINELNTIGEPYKKNIIQLNRDVNKTSLKDDQQVYIVDQDGNKTGVIVIPKSSSIFTKHSKHSIEIEIELPEKNGI